MTGGYSQAILDVTNDLKRARDGILADDQIPDGTTRTIIVTVLDTLIKRVGKIGMMKAIDAGVTKE